MEINTIKENWQNSEKEMNPGNADIINSRKKTSLENLADRYNSFSIISLVGAFLFCPSFLLTKRLTEEIPLTLLLGFCIYFLTASSMDFWLCRRIRKINVYTMTVENVLRLTMLYRKRHFQFMAVLIPFVLVLLTWMAIVFKTNQAVIIGMMTGFGIGLILGIISLLKFLRDYRTIMQ